MVIKYKIQNISVKSISKYFLKYSLQMYLKYKIQKYINVFSILKNTLQNTEWRDSGK